MLTLSKTRVEDLVRSRADAVGKASRTSYLPPCIVVRTVGPCAPSVRTEPNSHTFRIQKHESHPNMGG